MKRYATTDALAAIERTLLLYEERCTFFFGDADKARAASGPRVLWQVQGSTARAEVQVNRQDHGAKQPRPFDADLVTVVARCYGEARITPAAGERELRRAELAASEDLMAKLRWALRRTTPRAEDGWTGAHQVAEWAVVPPEGPEDRGTPIDLTFRIHLLLVAPAQPLAAPDTITIEGIDASA